MKKVLSKVKARLWTVLVMILAGMVFLPGSSALAAAMASFTPLASLDTGVDKPTAVATDGAGRIYVTESMNNRLRIFSQAGRLLAEIPGLTKPISVAVDGAGRIYVGSAWQGSVEVYDQSTLLFKLGSGAGEFGEPSDIDIDAAGQVYVTDKLNHTIRVYSPAGQLVRSIGTPSTVPPAGNGQLWHPCSLAIDPVSSELVVLDLQQIWDNYAKSWIDGARLQFFSMDGGFLRGYTKFGYNMDAGQLVKPVAVTVDAQSRVYVSDARLQKVMVYTGSNVLLGMIDNSAAPLRTPLGLAMGASSRLYVAALLSGRVDVYGIDNYSAIGVQPAALSFTATEGGEGAAAQETIITNHGRTEVAWSASTASGWLSLPAPGGVLAAGATGPVAVGVQHDGLAPGTYQGSVRIAASGMEEVVAVTLTVKPNPLQVSPASLTFGASEGTTPAPQVLNVVTGSGMLSWSAAADQGWLFLNKNSGSGADTIRVYANTAGLAVGSYAGTITVVNLAGGKSVAVAVNLTISEAGETIGETPGLPQPGEEIKAGGKNWRVNQPAAGVALRGVWGSEARNVLAVGDGGTILNYNGRDWRPMVSGSDAALRSIWGAVTAGSATAYAVGSGGTALHFDGTAWSPVSTGTGETLADVWGTTEVMAVGGYGLLLNLTQGTAANAELVLRSVWGSAAGDVFAAGESGVILHYDGTAWTAMDSDTSQWLNAIWGSAGSDIFAVGENGAIVHYDGSTWSTMESGVYESLHGVFGDAPDNVYAVGDNGVVLHYDGTGWSLVLAGGICLRDVWVADRLVVAVGDDGTVLTGRGSDGRGEREKKPRARLIGTPPNPEQGSKAGSSEVLQSPMLKGPQQTR